MVICPNCKHEFQRFAQAKPYLQRILDELKTGGPSTSDEMAAELDIPDDRACAYLCMLEACGLAVVEKMMPPRGTKGPQRKLWRAA